MILSEYFTCFDYVGVACVDGSCPNALCEDYPDFYTHVDCSDCFYNFGCDDCAFYHTEYCSKSSK